MSPDDPARIAIVVLSYDTPGMTDALAAYLGRDLVYANKKIFVVENGSSAPSTAATHVLHANAGFTRGMHEGYRIACNDGPFDAFWLLNSDVGFEYGNHVLADLVDVLFSSASFGQIAPQHNSPHKFMEHARHEAQPVPYLEPTATLVKASTIERIGFWDLDLTLGWGVDYDYGYRVRQAQLTNVLTNRARISHKEHRSIQDLGGYIHRASAEMNAVLAAKYGADWGRIMHMEPGIVPLVLSCDRDIGVASAFVESFRTLSPGLGEPIVIVDTSHSPRLSPEYVRLLVSMNPRGIFLHGREPGMSFYESVQEAANFALETGVRETGPDDSVLFVEDDISFAPGFVERLRTFEIPDDAGFVSLYLPGHGYGGPVINPDAFYGTQCLLFPRRPLELLVRERVDMMKRFLPGYDIRWSRYLASHGFRLYCTGRSEVQHLGGISRLHGHPSHYSERFAR